MHSIPQTSTSECPSVSHRMLVLDRTLFMGKPAVRCPHEHVLLRVEFSQCYCVQLFISQFIVSDQYWLKPWLDKLHLVVCS